jgi:hypothetical protein
MGKLIKCLLKELIGFLLFVLLAPLIYSFVSEAYFFLVSGVSFDSISWFVCGLLSYLFLYVPIAWIGDGPMYSIIFFEHLEHELGHSLVNFMFLGGTRKLIANPRNKFIELMGDPPSESEGEETSEAELFSVHGLNFLITLAPYYFPVFTVPLLIAKPLAFFPLREIINFLIGFTLMFHFVGLLREFRFWQSDIKDCGRIFSSCVTCLLNTIVLVIVVCVASGNYKAILDYFQNSIARTPESYQTELQILMMLNDLKDQLLQQ